MDVSWRCEPGINRAYTWLSDGTVVGHRDLDTGVDDVAVAAYADLHRTSVDAWLISYGVPCGPLQIPPSIDGSGPVAWWGRRRAARRVRQSERAAAQWRLDHPLWRVPIDAPHGGWRDLVRNDAGEALWLKAASLPSPSLFAFAARREQRAWTTGALGEVTVGHELQRIARRTEWRYVHSVPVGTRDADIDHVLVGPGGVLTVNTKSHVGSNIWVGGDTVMVNGRRERYVHKSRHEAERAGRLLRQACDFDVPTRGVIVVVDPRSFTVKATPSGVDVTTRRQLARLIDRLPEVLTPPEIDAVFRIARRSDTWTTAVTRVARSNPLQ